jgi:3-oxoacyl-[acyl-carrier protein] reductase
MSDFLLELSKNPQARRFIDSLGLPISLPEELRRARGPWTERPLDDATVVVFSGGTGELLPLVANTVVPAGANVLVADGARALSAFRGPAEAYARKAEAVSPAEPPEGARARALVVDATGFTTPASLRGLYDFVRPWARTLDKSGRVVVLARADSGGDVVAATTRAALEGFVRSLSKEIGRRGSTANVVAVERGAEERLAGVLRFVLSAESAFVTAQPIRVTKTARPNRSPGFTHALRGKVALVTGAARGIGEATARRIAEEGAEVVCADHPSQDGPLSQVARSIGGSTLLVDVSADDAPTAVLGTLRKRHGGVDIVVHNAGVTRDKTLGKMTEEQWDLTIGVNLAAPVKITRALLDEKVLRDEGRIVCLSSVAGIAGNAGQTNYAASKAGLIGFVRALAPEVASRGITANAVAPGFIETQMTAAMPAAIREVARRLSALGQGGHPVDVAEAITFLSMPWADGITGSTLRVCGGAFIGA